MRYELLLQTGQVDLPYDPGKVDAALAQRPVTQRPDGVRIWKLKAGEIEVLPLKEAGAIMATELRAPLSDKLELIRELVVEGAALAEEAGVRLYDPQLSRTITANDEGLVADQYFRTARYAGEMMGVPEAVAASFAPPDEGMKAGTKVVLAIVGLLVFVWFLFDWLIAPA